MELYWRAAIIGRVLAISIALQKGSLLFRNLAMSICGLPPHSAERLGLSEGDFSFFPEAKPQEKVIRGT